MNAKQIDLKIESKLISKIANHRLMLRETFNKRHKGAFPEINNGQCMHHVNELRIWLRIAELIDKGRWTNIADNPVKPYEIYCAEQLSNTIKNK